MKAFMYPSSVSVRFAPSPTGRMHLGNMRAAVMNYIFAQQKKGTFILRIEDTDANRNHDPQAEKILSDMNWLGLAYNDGPYFQSQRLEIYQKQLNLLQKNKSIYRCFCTTNELDKRRNRQIALKQPPRYDRTCINNSEAQEQEYLQQKKPYIWRMKLDKNKKVTINDLSHGAITFDFNNFSDFPVTRQDGSFTFMFANFVDDMNMNITHVLRGEDHLSNTAGQVALYNAFSVTPPIFWHMPILCNKDGKKMSKRDFGFSLQDLIDGGYLPESIINYLALIGGSQFKSEILSLKDIVRDFDFAHISSNSQVKYDVKKLNWINHKWIQKLSPQDLSHHAQKIITKQFPLFKPVSNEKLTSILQILKPSFTTLNDIEKEINFYFVAPKFSREKINSLSSVDAIVALVKKSDFDITNLQSFKQNLATAKISLKEAFQFLRMSLTGEKMGPSIAELVSILGLNETQKRLNDMIKNI